MRELNGLLVVFGLCIAANSCATVQESQTPLLSDRLQTQLERMSKALGIPDLPLSKNRLLVFAYCDGGTVTMRCFAHPRSDAALIARQLDNWAVSARLTGATQYKSESSASMAVLSHTMSRLGAWASTRSLPIEQLSQDLVAQGFDPTVVLGVGVGVEISPPMALTPIRASRYVVLRQDTNQPGSVDFSINVAKHLPVAAVLWVTAPFLAVFVGWALAVRIGKNINRPIAERRKLYGRVFLGCVFGIIALHGPLSVYVLTTRYFEPLTQLWFGQKFSTFGIFGILGGMFAVVGALPLMTKSEKKHLGPTPEEAAQQEQSPRSRFVVQQAAKPALPFISIFFVVLGTLRLIQGGERVGYGIAFLCMALASFGIYIYQQQKHKNAHATSEPDSELQSLRSDLTSRVTSIASRMGLSSIQSELILDPHYPRYAAVATSKSVRVTPDCLEQLPPGELDFLIAHELSHIKLGHLWKRQLMIFGPTMLVMIAAISMMLYNLGPSPSGVPAFASPFTPIIALFVPLVFVVWRVLSQQELDADRLALQTTRDRDAAISVLAKVALNTPLPNPDSESLTHPAMKRRIEALRLQDI